MEQPRGHNLLLVFVAVLSLVAGFWFGGDLRDAISPWAIIALGVCVLLGNLLGSPTSAQRRALSALLVGVLFAGGWYLADREIDRGFVDCVERGNEVREALELHHRMHGAYPMSLDELVGIDLPGERILRRSLLSYTRTSKGYELSFADRVTGATANHERGFFER